MRTCGMMSDRQSTSHTHIHGHTIITTHNISNLHGNAFRVRTLKYRVEPPAPLLWDNMGQTRGPFFPDDTTLYTNI